MIVRYALKGHTAHNNRKVDSWLVHVFDSEVIAKDVAR